MLLLLLPSSLLRTLISPLPPHLLDRVINLPCSSNKMSSMSRHYKSPKECHKLESKQTMWVFIGLFLSYLCDTCCSILLEKPCLLFSPRRQESSAIWNHAEPLYLGEGSNYWYPLSTSLPPTPRTTVIELKITRKPLCNSRIARVGGGSWLIHW